jgi:hypothetical protein
MRRVFSNSTIADRINKNLIIIIEIAVLAAMGSGVAGKTGC